ncbi:lipoprotein [Crossiella sp. CA198]|uniref:lipoprotein n=1 Tax=Crossiella sp. CA198 TaxID=3455607 RepID=UPI003F8D0642
MNARFSVPATAALLALLLTGCGGQGAGTGAPTSSAGTSAATSSAAAPTSAIAKPGEPWFDDVKVAESGGKVSAACQLPVDFELGKLWVAKTVAESTSTVMGKQGDFLVACEVDAKPAGNIGFLRVWTSKSTLDASKALENFMTGEKKAGKQEIRTTAAGSLAAAEVSYKLPDPINGGERFQRALAVSTPKGAVVLHLGGIDTDEHKQMLAAYVLARSSLTAKG